MTALVQPGAVLGGTYKVERLLGEGGMGAVVAARHVGNDSLVALKFMLPAALSFPQAAQRFFREGAVLSLLKGPNTPRVLDMGVLENGAPYLALEYLDGMDLAKVVRQYGALAVTDAVDFILQACAGVAEAHEHGVIHRDLKPGNLFLTQGPDGSPLVKVLDFGLSKILTEDEHDPADSASQTQTTGTMGTPAYMSPEQARSAKHVDPRSDIWSLGAILYYLLSAHLPFPAQATAEAFAKVLYEEHTRLREVAPWISPDLEAVIDRCLKKEREDRFQSVIELAAELERFSSSSEPASERSTVYRVIVQSPGKLDVGAMLQSRTTVQALETISPLALAGTLLPGQVSVHISQTVPSPGAGDVTEPAHRRTPAVIMAALAGMIAGAIIFAVVFLMARDGTQAAPAPATSPAGSQRLEPPRAAEDQPEPEAPAPGPAIGEEQAGSADPVAEGQASDSGVEPQGESRDGGAAKRRDRGSDELRRAGSRERSRSSSDAAEGKDEEPKRPRAPEDPFGTMD